MRMFFSMNSFRYLLVISIASRPFLIRYGCVILSLPSFNSADTADCCQKERFFFCDLKCKFRYFEEVKRFFAKF